MPEDLPIFFAYQQDPDAVRMAAFPARDRDAFDAHWTRVLQDVPAPPLHAHVAKSNGGSLRVLERCGFSIVGEDQAPP